MLERGTEPENISHKKYIQKPIFPDLSQMGGQVPLEVGSLCALPDDGHNLIPAGWLYQPVIHGVITIVTRFLQQNIFML